MSESIKGLEELLDNIKKLDQLSPEFGKEALKRVQDYSPVATGLLKDSWVLTSDVSNHELRLENTAQVEQGTYYAAFQEFGTVHDAPQLFLTRTVAESEDILKVAKQKSGL
jgi:HK97 gp10 family phage protein